MSEYDSRDLMTIKAAAREYDVPGITLELAIRSGALRTLNMDGTPRLLRHDVEQFVKRTIKRGEGTKIASRIRRS